MSRLLSILVLPALILGVSSGWAGEPASGPQRAADRAAAGARLDDRQINRLLKLHHVEEEKVRLILLPVNVRDRHGRTVRGLHRKDFRLYEDRVPQSIRYFSVEANEPIAVAFLLDVSGSMRYVGKLDEAKQAIGYFIRALRPQDRFALICFADEQVAWVTSFTSDRERFLRRLDVQRAYGQTALNDAVAAAPKLVFEDRTPKKKALVLVTDGVDNHSRFTMNQAIAMARRVNVPIFTIGFSSLPRNLRARPDEGTNYAVLKRFAEETGGTMYLVSDPAELKEAVLDIEEQLRYQYILGYHSSRHVWDGKFRTIRLDVANRRYSVRTRKGYYAVP